MKAVQVEIITIGNELLAGYTVNTNATFIAQQLLTIGISVGWVTTIRDSHEEILSAFRVAQQRADAVLVSGGLGPTPDDITKKCIAEYFGTAFIRNEQVFADISRLLTNRNLHLLQSNRDQALVPDAAEIIRNPVGTAPGLILQKNRVPFIFMPGVPQEMQRMLSGPVLAYLKENLDIEPVTTHLLRTTGITEAALYERVKNIVDAEKNIQLSFLPRGIGIDLRLKASIDTPEKQQAFAAFISALKAGIGKHVYTETDITMEEKIGELLRERSLTLATAESFTGGLIADWLTNVPGSSEYYMGSVIAYSNESKIRLLGVQPDTLETYGAVSENTVLEMLQGVRERFGTDCSIASTGIAGPGGGSDAKPVGLCYLAASCNGRERIKRFNFGENRIRTKRRGAIAGLELLRRLLLDIP